MTKTHAEFLKAVQDICAEKAKDAKAKTEKSELERDKQYHIGRRHAAIDILREITQVKLEDKHVEFLEGLKRVLIDDLIRYDQQDDYDHGRNEAARTYLGEIEQFQAKQGSNNENG